VTNENFFQMDKGSFDKFSKDPMYENILKQLNNQRTSRGKSMVIDSSISIRLRKNDYTSYTFYIKDQNLSDSKVKNIVYNYSGGKFLNSTIINYNLQTGRNTTNSMAGQLYVFANGKCGYMDLAVRGPGGTAIIYHKLYRSSL
jgi:hypothetical protein